MRDPYDPSARNPLFVSCSEIADNELYLLSKHFHPSVAAFANSLIEVRDSMYLDFAYLFFSKISYSFERISCIILF